MIELRVLGRFSARRDGEELAPGPFGGRLARTLVRVLITRRGSFVTREYLTEALWPKASPADPAMNINVLVQRARRALGDPGVILTGPGGYAFASGAGGTGPGRCQVDAEVFMAAAARAGDLLGQGRFGAALEAYSAALEGWWGEPLAEDVYEEWAQEYRALLLRAHLDALEGAARAALATGDPRAAAFSEQAVAQEPWREAAHLLHIRALAAAGDPVSALAAYERFRCALAEELGLDPSPEAQALQTRILRGERRAGGTSPPGPAQGFADLPFVGREAELGQILRRLEDPFSGPIALSGSPGTGKSRLVAEIAARSARPVLLARGFRSVQDEAWSVAGPLLGEVLALDARVAGALSSRSAQALADVVPELADLRSLGSARIDPEARRALAREGAARLFEAIAGQAPVVVVDDLHWADVTSLALLELLVQRVPRVGLVVAYRPHEATGEASAEAWVARLVEGSHDVARLSLGPLPEPAIAALAGDPTLAAVLVSETERTPLALSEALRGLAAQRLAEPGARGRWRALGPEAALRAVVREGQRRAIASRVAIQPPGLQALLSLLALFAREVPARLLASGAGTSQASALKGLESLSRADLVRLGARGWAVQHDVIAEVVVAGLDPASRAGLHDQLARALAADQAEQAEIAGHLVGAGDPEAAARAYAQASRRALDRFANGEAAALAGAGLDLAPPPADQARLLEFRAEARGRLGASAAAADDLRAALETGCADRARVLTALAMLTPVTDGYARAVELLDLALAEAGTDPLRRAEALAAGARLDLNLPDLARAEARSAEALALFEAAGAAGGIPALLETKGMICAQTGAWVQAIEHWQAAERRMRDAGRLTGVGRAQVNWGIGVVRMGNPHDGLVVIEEALALERSMGNQEGEAYCLWHRSEALVMLGRVAEAREVALEAIAVSGRIDHREWAAAGYKALGNACLSGGDLPGAMDAFQRCLELGADMPIFQSWALAGLAAVHLARHQFAPCRDLLARAALVGTPMSQLDTHRVAAQLAVASADPDAARIVNQAMAWFESMGDASAAAQVRPLLAAVTSVEQDRAGGAGRPRPGPGRLSAGGLHAQVGGVADGDAVARQDGRVLDGGEQAARPGQVEGAEQATGAQAGAEDAHR